MQSFPLTVQDRDGQDMCALRTTHLGNFLNVSNQLDSQLDFMQGSHV